MRRLIYIRVIHSPVDFSNGIGFDVKKENFINSFWDMAEKELGRINLRYSQTRLYQDGYCEDGKEIYAEMEKRSADGSRNYKLILNLIKRGAKLMLTENEELCDNFRLALCCEEEMAKIRRLRDKYIAKQISQTLKDDETGILIMGANHNVDDYLPKDIKVFYLKKSDEFLANFLKRMPNL
ncbi:MAG: hypothetical protein A3I89_02670 [Candidatus Harrisonbacteria bacterium RIFCSPLOWO2_02_FULL_41_11]|uniref:Uncharacterized protein n=1 Tax=Candidatus Harrisonbacteria bacterium RIFCSPHIGHO2_02_FULL_42_16 TaxID=1798404 RepID=A0A1G1ZL66_9BACT|nr:MAG: hypothetical protein A3B92_00380 [Candidatus Harrisonbacteria bacterium RIFCSPHIGHO2_02_FULL_42_16]OGY66563.1 MAG: hypothetical protein A3I89_02670 [Candidatus Harrisonbacteria bacterium RIFCSPLOWO2_02_FULL_41_11]